MSRYSIIDRPRRACRGQPPPSPAGVASRGRKRERTPRARSMDQQGPHASPRRPPQHAAPGGIDEENAGVDDAAADVAAEMGASPRRAARQRSPSPLSTRRFKRMKEEQTPKEHLQMIFDNSRLAWSTVALDIPLDESHTAEQLMEDVLSMNVTVRADERVRGLANAGKQLGDVQMALTTEARIHASRLTAYPIDRDNVVFGNVVKNRLDKMREKERQGMEALFQMDDVYFNQRVAVNQLTSLLVEFSSWSEDAQSLIDYSATFNYGSSPTMDHDRLDTVVCPRVDKCIEKEERLLEKWKEMGQRRDDERLTRFPQLGAMIPVRDEFNDKMDLLQRVVDQWTAIQFHCTNISARHTDYGTIYDQFIAGQAQQMQLFALYDTARRQYNYMKLSETSLREVLNGIQGWTHYLIGEAERMIRDVERKHVVLNSTMTLYNKHETDELRDEVVVVEEIAAMQEGQLTQLVGQMNRLNLSTVQLQELKERFDDQASETRQSIGSCLTSIAHLVRTSSIPDHRRVTLRSSLAKFKKIQLSSLQWSYVMQLEVQMVGSIQPLSRNLMEKGRRRMIASGTFNNLFGTMLPFQAYHDFCSSQDLYIGGEQITPDNYLNTHRVLLNTDGNNAIPVETLFDMMFRRQMGCTKHDLIRLFRLEFGLDSTHDRRWLMTVLGESEVLNHLLVRLSPALDVFPVSTFVDLFFT